MRRFIIEIIFLLSINLIFAVSLEDFGFQSNSPLFEKIECFETQDKINFKYYGFDICISFDAYKAKILVTEINSDFVLAQNFSANRNTIGDILLVYLTEESPSVLITYYISGATGLSANIECALLLEFKDRKADISELSTFGGICSNFSDVDNDNEYEFICIGLVIKERGEHIYAPNIFKHQNNKWLNCSNQKTAALCIKDSEKYFIELGKTNYKLLGAPNVFTK